MTAPREIEPGRFWFLSRRCTQRQFLLRPDEKTTAIWSYCLAVAADRYNIELIGWDQMSNHHHAVVFDRFGNLPEFLEHFHKMVAKALNRRWGRWENFWSSDQASASYLPTLDAVIDKLVYVLANPILGGLIDRVVDWPGSSSLQYMDGRARTLKRPVGFFRPDGPMPETVELRAVQPTLSAEFESLEQWATRIRDAVETIERDARAERERTGGRVVGRKAVLDAAESDSPKTVAPRRNLRPAVACRDKERRILELQALAEFRRKHAEALAAFMAGDHTVEFPSGTYRMRRLGARCAPHRPLAA